MVNGTFLRAAILLGFFCLAGSAVNAAELYVTPALTYVDDDPDRAADDVMGVPCVQGAPGLISGTVR